MTVLNPHIQFCKGCGRAHAPDKHVQVSHPRTNWGHLSDEQRAKVVEREEADRRLVAEYGA